MHRIDADAHVGNLFDPGDPGVPRAPTQVDHHWLNALQEEVAAAVEAAGITLVKGTNTQLKAAMGMGATPAATARNFSGTLTVDVGTGNAIVGTTAGAAGTAGVTGNSELRTGVMGNTGDGIAGQFNVTGTGKAIEANGPVTVNNNVTMGGANPAVGTALTNVLTPAGIPKAWARVTWNNAAPVLADGLNMASIGNPAAGQIQLNLAAGTVGAVVVTGNAGAGNWIVVPQNITGLVQIIDLAGAAVNFAGTAGFAYLVVHGKQ